jgi:hypothetical protein
MPIPQQSIIVHFVHEWRTRKPNIYRYLHKKYVDEFFKVGNLRLSSFVTFSQHSDEQRRDTKEGSGIVYHENKSGQGQWMMAATSQGHNAYVLCASTIYQKKLASAFGTNSGFRIDNIIGFCEAVSRYLPGFIGGIDGPCLYLSENVISRDLGRIDMEAMKTTDGTGNYDLNKAAGLVSEIAGDDLVFLKSERYVHQYEYRTLWMTSNTVNGCIDIKCPEARQYCTRFEEIRLEHPKTVQKAPVKTRKNLKK